MAWKLAPALVVLRAQVDKALPKRSKASDGTIGDARHQAEAHSDHNPNAADIVCAWDCTATPANPVWQKLADDIADDSRTGYVIFDRHINGDGRWLAYRGSDPHTNHIHVSVRQTAKAWNDARSWKLPSFAPKPTVRLTCSKHNANRLEGYVLSGVTYPMAKVVMSYRRPGETLWRPWVTLTASAAGGFSVGTRGYRVGTYTYRAMSPASTTLKFPIWRYGYVEVGIR